MNEKIQQKVRPWLSASVLVGVAALGVSVAQSGLGFLDYIRGQLSDNAECCESFRAYRTEDSGQRRYWVSIIDGHKKRLLALDREVAKISAKLELLTGDPKARPDPFTGSDADELEERLLESIEKLKKSK